MTTLSKAFTPRRAVKTLHSGKKTALAKTLALAELLSWMALDQKKGQRKINPAKGGYNRPRFSSRHASLARNVVIASLLHRQHQASSKKRNAALIFELLGIFWKSDGFGLFLQSPRSPKRWLSRLQKAEKTAALMYEIILYLCRYHEYGDDPKRGGVEYAKAFVAPRSDVKPRTLGQYWEINKQAAPYIFAFYKPLFQVAKEASSVTELVDFFSEMSANQSRLDRLLGNAAYAADVLVGLKVRNVRKKDFEAVRRVKPKLAPFSEQERHAITDIDIRALSEKDKKPYRPKSILGSHSVAGEPSSSI